MKHKLTICEIEKLGATGKEYEVRDGAVAGFCVRVSKQGAKTYYIRFRVEGVERRYKIGSTSAYTLAQARDKAKILIGRLAQGDKLEPIPKTMTLGEFLIEHYIPWSARHRRRQDAVLSIATEFKSLMNTFLSSITPRIIEQWRMEKTKRASLNRANYCIQLLSGALSRAVDWGYLKQHPLHGKMKMSVKSACRVRYLNRDELTRFLTQVDTLKRGDKLRVAILLSLYTGLRRNELLQISWDDIDHEHKILTVRQEVAKSGKLRRIGLCNRAYSALMELPKREGLIVANAPWWHFQRIVSRAGIVDFRWHDMRHHFASSLVQAGIDLYVVKELLGHSTIQMTERYAHLRPDDVVRAVRVLDEAE